MDGPARRIVLIDDHAVVRQGIRSILDRDGRFDVLAEGENGFDAVVLARQFKPELMLIDIAMPHASGIDVIEEVRRWSPDTRIVVLTGLTSRVLLGHARGAGAHGVFLKSGDVDRLPEELIAVCNGEVRLGAEVKTLLDEDVADASSRNALTARERQVLFGIARGETNAKLAERLGISANTVDNHRSSIMRKLNVHSVAELLAYALREGMLDVAKHV